MLVEKNVKFAYSPPNVLYADLLSLLLFSSTFFNVDDKF